MNPSISFEGVTFSYPSSERSALRDVTFRVPEGAFVLVTGATGSGKSTLLRAANGLVPHFSGGTFHGRVVTAGRSTLDHAPRELADVVAFVPQEAASSFVMDNVEDEVAYGMENLGIAPERMRRRVEETLDLLAIEKLRDRSSRTLSGGERQRVAIAAALAAGPRVLVLDEPTSQLDPQGAEDVLAALQRLVHDLGMTVLLAEHRLERVAGFVDLAVGLRDGVLVRGAPGEVIEAVGSAPPATRVGRMLGWAPPPLTVREARRLADGLDLRGGPPPSNGFLGGRRLLEAAGLFAGYGDADVLRDASLTLSEGDVVALMGRNGSRKTTLLRCLAGLHDPRAGTVAVGGRPPSPGTDVALCPQTPEDVLFRETVEQEIQTTIDAWGNGTTSLEVARDVGIERLLALHPRDTSAGERLLVAVAAIAATPAPVLLLDEPTRGLDPRAKDTLGRYLRRRAASGRATVFATHDVELAATLATRVVMLAAGEVIAQGRPEVVLGDSPVFAPQMSRVFGAGWLTPEQVAAAAGSERREPPP